MNWAFWRPRKPNSSGRAGSKAGLGPDESTAVSAGRPSDAAAQLRTRARRRLIGATVLLLGTAVVVPMLLDPAPRPLPDSIPIDIPSERTSFAPRLSLPQEPAAARGNIANSAVVAAGAHGTVAPEDTAGPAVQDSSGAERALGDAAAPAGTSKAASERPGASHSEAAASGGVNAKADGPHWIVQAAAL